MIRRAIIAASVSAASLGGLVLAAAPAAHADGSICYNIQANVAGNQLVSQAGCQALPAPPAPPALP